MKVLQVNTVYKEGSTGRNCFEVKKALEREGHKCYVAYGRGQHDDANTYRIGTEAEYYLHNIMARLTGLQGYFSFCATMRFIRYIRRLSPDIIHLHNLHANYLNLPLFFRFLKTADIPVVLNLHDCWAFTGKCTHYTDRKCLKWKTCCFSCPAIHQYPHSWFFDCTSKLHRDKKKWFADIKDLTVVGVSKWTAEQAKMSFLGNRKILFIYNWIDQGVFYPRRSNVLADYGINTSRFIILGVSASWQQNSPRYKDFIKLSNIIPDDMQIVLVGKSKITEFPKNISHIPYVNSTEKLASIYSSADVYVHMSTEDTFGKVIAEAMACGTPAIVYDSTALPELVPDGCGYKVKPRDVNHILSALKRIRDNGKDYYTAKCILNVKRNFDYLTNTQKLIKTYELISILNRCST